MARNRVFVEVRFKDGYDIVRIFPHFSQATASRAWKEGRVIEYPRRDAVEIIRRKVFQRAKNQCERCSKRLTWDSMHLDEKISRGEGGFIGMENSWALCADCHILRKDSEHGDRRLMFGEST